MSSAAYYKILAEKVFPRESGAVDRRVLLGGVLLLPTVAVGLVGYFWFTAPAQPEFAAKLWVLRGNDEQVLVRAFVGSQPLREPFATEVELVLQGAGVDPKRWRARTSSDGVADFSLHDITRFDSVSLEHEANKKRRVLVAGPLRPANVASWITSTPVAPLRAPPAFDTFRLELTPAVLAVPFLSRLKIEHGRAGCFARLSGADLLDPKSCCDQGCEFYPTQHVVEVELGHVANDKLAAVLLPVLPGAMFVAVRGETMRVYSATPKTNAHVAWLTEDTVLGLANVSMARSTLSEPVTLVPAGTPVYMGTLALGPKVIEKSERDPVWIIASSEPDFVSNATLSWPLGALATGRSLRFAPRPVPAEWDGFEQQQRQRNASFIEQRRTLGGVLFAVLVADFALLWVYARRFNSGAGEVVQQASRLWWIVIVCLLLAWCGLAAFFWWK